MTIGVNAAVLPPARRAGDPLPLQAADAVQVAAVARAVAVVDHAGRAGAVSVAGVRSAASASTT